MEASVGEYFTLPAELQEDLVGWEWFRPVVNLPQNRCILGRRCSCVEVSHFDVFATAFAAYGILR